MLFAHPGQRYSRANRDLAQAAIKVRGVTFVDLYAEYPRHKIDVEKEQQRLLDHDVILFQFPMFWYSTPSILKEWQDLVLEYGFAYGKDGDKIAGKLFSLVVTTGGPSQFYQKGGRNNFTIRELLTPLEQTANLCGLHFVPPYTLFAAHSAGEDTRLAHHVEGYERFLGALRDNSLDMDKAGKMPLLSADALPILQGAQP